MVAVLIEFLELKVCARGIVGGWRAIGEDASEVDGIVRRNEMVDAWEDDVWIVVSSDMLTANVSMDCC